VVNHLRAGGFDDLVVALDRGDKAGNGAEAGS
jgi:hypothetical protein